MINLMNIFCKLGIHKWKFLSSGAIVLDSDNSNVIFTEDFKCIKCGKQKRDEYKRCWESEETNFKRYHSSICEKCGRVSASRSWRVGEGGYYCGQGDSNVIGEVIKNCDCKELQMTNNDVALRGKLFGV